MPAKAKARTDDNTSVNYGGEILSLPKAVVHHSSSSHKRKKRKRKAAGIIIPGKSLSRSRSQSDDARFFSAVKSEDASKTHLAEQQLTGRANSTSKQQQNQENTRETNELQQSSSLPWTTKRASMEETDSSALSHHRDGRALRYEALWQSRLNDLRDYKKEHGDCLVPRDYKGHQRLGEWVNRQRQLYKKSLLRKDRIEALEAEGFVWSVQTSFEHRVLEFIAYREIYGTCYVPTVFPTYPAFGNWANHMRSEYIKFRDDKPSRLTLDQFEALDAEGFIWVDHENLPWRERFLQLVEFRKQFGHCNVSRTRDCKILAGWVKHQRAEYWKHYVGEKSTMTRQKIEELENIGFVWCLRAKRSG